MIGKDAVLSHDGNDVGGNTHCHKVEQWNELTEGNAIADGKRLHEFETYATTRQIFVRIGGILTLGIEDGNCWRQFLVGHVVVANNEINAQTLGIGNFFDCLDAAVEHNDEFYTRLVGVVHTLNRHPISLLVSVGNVVVEFRIELLQEAIYQCDSSASIHIVVAINHHPLSVSHRLVQAVNRAVHIAHEERVMKCLQLRAEISACFVGCGDSPLHKQEAQRFAHTDFLRQFSRSRFLFWCRFFVVPFVIH